MAPINNISFPENHRPERTEQTEKVSQNRAESHNQSQEIGRGVDQASISPEAQQVSELRAELNKTPEVRQERVEALQKAMQEGSFQVSNEQISEAMLSDLFGNREPQA